MRFMHESKQSLEFVDLIHLPLESCIIIAVAVVVIVVAYKVHTSAYNNAHTHTHHNEVIVFYRFFLLIDKMLCIWVNCSF